MSDRCPILVTDLRDSPSAEALLVIGERKMIQSFSNSLSQPSVLTPLVQRYKLYSTRS